jgi:hypothetical protein
VIHHRQRLALVVETGQHLRGVHPELHNFKGDLPANGLHLFGQINGSHTAFTYWPHDMIAAEVVITDSRCSRIDDLNSAFVRGERTVEGAEDQTLRTQSAGITGVRFLAALSAVWHGNRAAGLFYVLRRVLMVL